MAGQKRKLATTVDNTPTTSTSPPNADKTTPQSTSKKSKKTKTKETAVAKPSEEHPASIYKTLENPQASFEGLPAELRLEIYDHLCHSTIVHVHKHINKKKKTKKLKDSDNTNFERFTWTPCRLPNPKYPLLCANPKWSGMCTEEERCTHKVYAPPEPRGFWALAASSKQIRNETHGCFFRKSVISIHGKNLQSWLDYLAKHAPHRMEHLRRITLAGPSGKLYSTGSSMQLLCERVPKLEGVGIQTQDDWTQWMSSPLIHHFEVLADHRRMLDMKRWVQPFDPSVTVVLEAMVYYKWWSVHTYAARHKDQQIVFRLLRKGKKDEDGADAWNDEDVTVDIDAPAVGKLVARRQNAKWRPWWHEDEVGFQIYSVHWSG
ncbi:hypothetical protein BDW02DRAFT_34192 [Decorospora gaudefroyi]|uniref:Uncharacterized protein n=1 Tax=Decorospora gaudefroyi TaxID=184978 RepID=A0A6A5KQ08_9PLEO|nr:hypothetical protein BDW02DRAFT_34192 [Decorospora gaudefroyi]